MALPLTISGVLVPGENYFLGPFESGGQFYIVVIDSTDQSLVEVHMATDPTDSFAEQDGAGRPDMVNGIISMWVHQEGTDLHVATQEQNTSRVAYSLFDMSSDTWDGTIVNEEVVVPSPASGVMGVSISVRSDGDVIILYQGSQDNVHGSDRHRVDYARREGGSWTTGIAVDNGGAVDWFLGNVVRGSSDRMHFFFTDDTNNDAYQRTLTSANSLETFPSAGDSDVDPADHCFGRSVSYDDGGTQRVRAPYRDVSQQISLAEFDSADAPGAFTVNADVTTNDVSILVGTIIACMAVNGVDEHILFSESATRDLFHNKDGGTDEEILDAVSVFRISCNIYDRSGTKLAYLYNDNNTIKYNEVDIGVAALPGEEDVFFPGLGEPPTLNVLVYS